MEHPTPVPGEFSVDSFLSEHGMTQVTGHSDPELPLHRAHPRSPDDVALRLAFIGDQMEVRWARTGRAVRSLAFTFTWTGARGVIEHLLQGLTNLGRNMRLWGFLIIRDPVPPGLGRELVLPLVLLLLLGWGLRLL